MIKKFLAFSIITIVLFSCSEKKNNLYQTNDTKKQELPSPEIAVKKEEETYFNNENASELLTLYGKKNPETIVEIETEFGTIKLRLFKDTPLHRANFIRLIKLGYYDQTIFYRITKGFVVQGGRVNEEMESIYQGAYGSYKIPDEISPSHIHKKGTLSMAKEYDEITGKPLPGSSSFDFFIVTGHKYTQRQLNLMELEKGISLSLSSKKTYINLGGAPHLDKKHTVFGEVVDGFNTIKKMMMVKTDPSDFPLKDVGMKIKIIE